MLFLMFLSTVWRKNILKVLIRFPSNLKIGNVVNKEKFTNRQPGQLTKPRTSRQRHEKCKVKHLETRNVGQAGGGGGCLRKEKLRKGIVEN